jgi:hypothetical protein
MLILMSMLTILCSNFFLNDKLIFINNKVSAQNEQRLVKERLQNKGAVFYVQNVFIYYFKPLYITILYSKYIKDMTK